MRQGRVSDDIPCKARTVSIRDSSSRVWLIENELRVDDTIVTGLSLVRLKVNPGVHQMAFLEPVGWGKGRKMGRLQFVCTCIV